MLAQVFLGHAVSQGTRIGSCAALLLAFAAGLCAQNTPLIYNRSITNAASLMPAGLPNGAIAQGSIFTLYGTRLGPSTGVLPSTFPLATTLGGASINVIQGNTAVAAIPVYVSSGQINAIMPSNAPIGNASLQIVTASGKSNLAPIRIVATAFGIVSLLSSGQGPGAFINASQTGQPINSPTVVAQPGQIITLYGTGLGPVSYADNIAPQAGNLPVKTEVFVGGVSASVAYSGRTPCCSGEDQIVFTIPQNAPQGCWVPVYVRTGGATVSNFVTMAIGPNPSACTTDVLPQISSAFINGQSIGQAMAVRTTTREDVGTVAPVDVTSEYAVSVAIVPPSGPFPFNPALSFPPTGTCTAFSETGDILDSNPLPNLVPATVLDWGPPLQLTGPNGNKTLNTTFTPTTARVGFLDGVISNSILSGNLFLTPGNYTLTGFGGNNIGAFTANFTIPQPFVWTQQDTTTMVDHTQPLTLSWTGGDSGQLVAILFYGVDLPTNSSYVMACVPPAGASSFTIPTDLMSNLPLTRSYVQQSKDIIYFLVLAGSSLSPINATGLDVGFTEFISIVGKTVVIQ